MVTMKRLLSLLWSVCNCALLIAGPIDFEKAKENAIQFVSQKASRGDGSRHAPLSPQNLRLAQKVMTGKDQPAYYVFNKDGGGFVIVSGDDLAAPILGYSDVGSFDAASLPEGLRDLLKNYEKQIAFVSSQNESKPKRINDNWDEISPMVKTHWNQGKPYNTLCPIDPTTNQRSITGCVAVALGQLMYYYKWPEVGTGRVSYQWNDQTLSADFSKVHFQWDKMKLDYNSNTPDDGNSVATLLYNCALACHANFGSYSTCASYTTETLSQYFGYKNQMAMLSLNQTTIDDFEATIYHELKNARPVLFDANDEDVGHAMVIDGFKDGYFHINFGWSGDQDGYYQLTAILTDWDFFNTRQSIIYNIQPDYEPHLETHLYPESSYTLSADGTALVKWKGTETEIDMAADAAFNEVRRINSHAFSANSTVTSVILPNKAEVIETKAFENCGELESLFIPQSVIKIEPQAFTKCPYLDQFVVSDNSSNYVSKDGMLIDINENVVVACAAGLSGNIAIPDGIVGISNYVFEERQIASMKMPKSLKKIEEGAFMGCQLLSTVVLQSELEFIGAKAFKGCTGLKQITVMASTPPQVENGAFDDIDCPSVYLCVSSVNMNQYLYASGWNQFTTIIGTTMPEAKKLVVYMKDGTMDSYMLSDKPVIRNMGQDLFISTTSSSKAYKIDKIKRMQYFEEEADPTLPEDEPYAVYKDGTLTFYYDQSKKSRRGETFELNVDYDYPDWYWKSEVTKVVFDASFAAARPTTTYRWFCGMGGMTAIEGMQYLNTSNVTNMAYMFRDCSALTSLDVSHFDTSNVRDMSNMFYYLYLVTSLDVSHFDTSNCTDMSSMFEDCFHLGSLDVSHFNTSKVTTMNSMFSQCYPLTSLDVSHFDTSKCKDLGWMFYDCYNLTSLDVSNFNTSNCTNMEHLFSMCSGLTSLDVSNFNTSSCTNMNGMFYDCWKLKSLDVSHFDTSKCTSIDEMFKYDSGLEELSISSSMVNLGENACEDVGDYWRPCTIFAPEGFNFGVDTSGEYFVWKSGYFILGNTIFAVSIEEVKLKIGETEKVQLIAGHGDYSISNNHPDLVKVELDGEAIIITATDRGVATITITDNKTKQIATVEVRVTAPTTMKVEPMEIHFYLPKGSSKSEYFTVYNTGDGTLTFHLDYSTDGIFNVLDGGEEYVLEAGESKSFTLVCSVPEDYEYYGEGMALRIYSDATNWDSLNDWIGVSYRPTEPEPETEMAYAVFKDGTLTFYYDKQRNSRDGTSYELNLDEIDPAWFGVRFDVTKVVFDASFAAARPTTTYRWFCGMGGMTAIEGMQYLNTSNVTNMAYMFRDCSALTSLDVSHFDTSNVRDMSNMFYYLYLVTSLDVSHFDTSNCTDMSSMFEDCFHLGSLDVSHFNTSKVTTMNSMFSQCYPLTSLDVSHFDTSKCKDLGWMFYDCYNLTSLDVSNFNTSNCTNMEHLFSMCSGLTSLDVSNFNTSSCTNMNGMFYDCWKLKSLDVSHFDTSKCTSIDEMFKYDSGLEELSISSSMVNLGENACEDVGDYWRPCTIFAPEGFDFGVDTSGDCFYWKSGCFKKADSKEMYAWLSSEGKTMTFCYDNKRAEREGETYRFTVEEYYPVWNPDPYETPWEVTTVVFDPSFVNARPTTTYKWFQNFINLTEIKGLQYLNTSKVTNMEDMFASCKNLSILDLSSFNTSNVTNMSWMFYSCESLKSINLSSFDTSKVTDMSSMFMFCESLNSLDVSHFNTSNVVSTFQMFDYCSLSNLDISNFDMSKCENSERMIYLCSNLKTLSVSPTMENLDETACIGVGSISSPCTIFAPEGFNFGVDTSGDYFVWKQGTFKLGTTAIQGLPDFSQLPPYSHVEIFNTAGKLVKSMDIGEYPQALDLNGIGIGVFLVNINGVTYKIFRK